MGAAIRASTKSMQRAWRFRGDDVLVGYEQLHRVSGYRPLLGDRDRPSVPHVLSPAVSGRRTAQQWRAWKPWSLSPKDEPACRVGSWHGRGKERRRQWRSLFAGILDGPVEGRRSASWRYDGFDVTDGDLPARRRPAAARTAVHLCHARVGLRHPPDRWRKPQAGCRG